MRGSIFLVISIIFCLTICCTGERFEEDIPVGYKQRIKDFQMLETKEGIINWRLNANTAYIYEENIRIQNLSLIFFNKDGKKSAHITAPKGLLYTKTHDMVAYGGVEAITIDSTKLNTDSLFFHNESTQIKTDSEVIIIRSDGTELTGKGLKTTPDLTKIEIGGKVEGITPLEPER